MPKLYHYTTPAGIEGIIRTKSFWATEYRFLNDRTEFEHGLRFLKEALKDGIGDYVPNRPDLNLLVTEYMSQIDQALVFVASFTRKGDLLSQWRGYNDGRGFSIGVDEAWLSHSARKNYFKLVQVIYDRGNAQSAVYEAVARLAEMLRSAGIDDDSRILRRWWRSLLTVCASLKNRHFAEEDEYRLVRVNVSGSLEAKIRTSRVGLIPYTECFLTHKPEKHNLYAGNFGFRKVYVGPNLNERQIIAMKSLQSLHKMDFEVKASSIPYTSA